MLAAPFNSESLRRPAHTADGEGFLFFRRIDQRWYLAADAVALWLQQIEAEAHRRRRVNGVAALLHDAKASSSGQVMP